MLPLLSSSRPSKTPSFLGFQPGKQIRIHWPEPSDFNSCRNAVTGDQQLRPGEPRWLERGQEPETSEDQRVAERRDVVKHGLSIRCPGKLRWTPLFGQVSAIDSHLASSEPTGLPQRASIRCTAFVIALVISAVQRLRMSRARLRASARRLHSFVELNPPSADR